MNYRISRTTSAPKMYFTIILLSLSLLTSCSTMTKSVLLGAGVGGIGGGMLGSTVGPGTGTVPGAAIGAAIGGLIGYAAFKSQEKHFQSSTPAKDLSKETKVPSVTMPQVRRIWVPDKIEGNKYEAGHYIFILEKTSNWSQPNDK